VITDRRLFDSPQAQFFNNQNKAPFEKLNSNIMDEITLWRRADQFADDLSAIIIEIK
jgi:hypothetical protein